MSPCGPDVTKTDKNKTAAQLPSTVTLRVTVDVIGLNPASRVKLGTQRNRYGKKIGRDILAGFGPQASSLTVYLIAYP